MTTNMTTSTANILLKISGLQVGYGGIQAVKGVDFEAPTAQAKPPP
jgi:ABC-type branched-subunit amino acid transport system ATPase component